MWRPWAGSRVCAVAQYAVLEANAKVNGRGPFSLPHPSETPQPISMSCQIYYYVPQGVDVQNLVGIDSAVTDLRIIIYLSICLSVCPFLRRGYRSQFWGDFHGLRGSGSPVLTATGFVNGRWQFSTPHRIHTP